MDGDSYFRFFLALIFVLGLIGVFAVIGRRLGLGFPTGVIKGPNNRRIGVVEVAPLDGRRKLVLVRRDDVEHLLVVSPTRETVIETGIPGSLDFQAALKATAADDGAPESTSGTGASGDRPS